MSNLLDYLDECICCFPGQQTKVNIPREFASVKDFDVLGNVLESLPFDFS